MKYTYIVVSPIANDILLIIDEDIGVYFGLFEYKILKHYYLKFYFIYFIGKFTKVVGKYPLHIALRELHNDFIKIEL